MIEIEILNNLIWISILKLNFWSQLTAPTLQQTYPDAGPPQLGGAKPLGPK